MVQTIPLRLKYTPLPRLLSRGFNSFIHALKRVAIFSRLMAHFIFENLVSDEIGIWSLELGHSLRQLRFLVTHRLTNAPGRDTACRVSAINAHRMTSRSSSGRMTPEWPLNNYRIIYSFSSRITPYASRRLRHIFSFSWLIRIHPRLAAAEKTAWQLSPQCRYSLWVK